MSSPAYFASLLALVPFASAQTTTRISVGPNGEQGDYYSHDAVLSADARYVAFVSRSSQFVPGDTNGMADVFLRDLVAGTIERVSIDQFFVQGNHDSDAPSISARGRHVAFSSRASNWVPGDLPATDDVFVYHRAAGVLELVSVGMNGGPATGGRSLDPSISADGRYVAFWSLATDLVPEPSPPGVPQVYVRDLWLWTTRRVSLNTAGAPSNGWGYAPALSGSARVVAFATDGTNLVPGDTNARIDVFVRRLPNGPTVRTSVGSSGVESNFGSTDPSISFDGRLVAFSSLASNLVPGDTNAQDDVFVRDMATGITTIESLTSTGTLGDYHSDRPRLSPRGEFLVFRSGASNLVPGDTNGQEDIFLRDRTSGTLELVSVATDGTQSNAGSARAHVSTSGHAVIFESSATNLAPGDTNGVADIFLRVR